MSPPHVSVVIATHNRASLVTRAIRSAQRQPGNPEIIVVDDASTDDTAQAVTATGALYLRQTRNQGPGPARDRGIAAAQGDLVVILDDDDELLPDALENVLAHVSTLPEGRGYPVVQFSHTNGMVADGLDFRVLSLNDYLTGKVRGDFAPVIVRRRYTELGLRYPDNRAGGEHLLWWKVAERYGLPTWSRAVMTLHDDAPERLVSAHSQLRRAADHLWLAEETLDRFGDALQTTAPALYRSTALGAGVYALLAGKRPAWRTARTRLEAVGATRAARALAVLGALPRPLLRPLFVVYRRVWSRIR